VLFAHPDDEFAVFPWLRAAINAGRPVDVAWLTDGGWGGQDVGRRRRESIAVLSKLGIKVQHMHFLGEAWGIADGELYRRLDEVIPRLHATLGATARHADLLIPAWEGGHHDHDACHLVGIFLAKAEGANASQYSLYHGEALSGPWFKVLSPLPENGVAETITTSLWERLGHAARCLRYRSQWKSFLGLMPFYLWRMRRADAFVRQPVIVTRTSERPHAGLLLYERRGGPSWDEFSTRTIAYRFPQYFRNSEPAER